MVRYYLNTQWLHTSIVTIKTAAFPFEDFYRTMVLGMPKALTNKLSHACVDHALPLKVAIAQRMDGGTAGVTPGYAQRGRYYVSNLRCNYPSQSVMKRAIFGARWSTKSLALTPMPGRFIHHLTPAARPPNITSAVRDGYNWKGV